MFFNSIEFAIFLPVVFLLYWLVFSRNAATQNAFILVVSYFFYGWWDWRFLFLIAFCSTVNFCTGIALPRITGRAGQKALLVTASVITLGCLGFFKYYNFFVDSLVSAFQAVGMHLHPATLNIILPVGISFYTFRALSYSIDVYRKKINATNNVVTFFSYIAFFPQLMAGPIERATNMLPQFDKKRTFDYAQSVDAMRQILWGLFKKVVIADNCAVHVNMIFEHHATLPASVLAVGAVYFAFQIYGDFSGYSDIAIGCSRLLGFHSMQNFAYPYFSRDIAEFWRRWHISLTTWFRDYLYIPLGGNRGPQWKVVGNICIVFLLSGLWHGANWTFIVWGLLNALYFLPLMLSGRSKRNRQIIAQGTLLPTVREAGQMLGTFGLATFGWIFFRAAGIEQALSYIKHMFSLSILRYPIDVDLGTMIALILFMVVFEWLHRDKEHGLYGLRQMNVFFRNALYVVIIVTIYYYYNFTTPQQFVYFQF